MRKTFGKAVYDTETAELVFKYTHGYFGDPNGYEEILYKNEKGNYFVYGNGGENSEYAEEKIVRITKDKVEAWIDAHR